MGEIKQLGGMSQFRIGNTVLMYLDGLKHNFQQALKKGVVGRDGRFHGARLSPQVPYIEGEFSHDGSLTTADYEKLAGDAVASNADGSSLVLRDGFVAGEVEIDDVEGKVKLRFEGAAGEELRA
jgi:hypothetical protein